MKQRLIDFLYVFIILSVFIFVMSSMLFGWNLSKLEEMSITLFGAIVSVSAVCSVLMDDMESEDKE